MALLLMQSTRIRRTGLSLPMLSPFKTDRTLKPIFAAILMGAVVALSLVWTQKGIHVSGVFSLLCPPSVVSGTPTTDALSCSIHSLSAKKDWVVWMVSGIFVGAFLTSLWRNRELRFEIERGNEVGPAVRLMMAAAGGIVVGIGAALAGGCTSSIGLTGSAVFSVASFAFLAVFFAGGFAARIFLGRFWNA